jgi:hypothetical protein
VQNELDGNLGVGEPNGAQDLLGVLDADVADQWKPQKRHAFLAMDEENDPGAMFLFNLADRFGSRCGKHSLLDYRLQRREYDENPKDV